MNGQSRAMSGVETMTNLVVGLALAWVGNAYIFPPLMGYEISEAQSAGVATGFTVLSIIHQYGLRRLFNWLHVWRGNGE